jgi:SAM-dependent methyltransferase
MPNIVNCPICKSELNKPYAMRIKKYYPHVSRSRCQLCGTVYANPMATKDELVLFYNSYYDKGHFQTEEFKKRTLLMFESIKPLMWAAFHVKYKRALNYYHLQYVQEGKFLDIGCGLGNNLMIADKCNYTLYATEYDADAIAFVNKIFPKIQIFKGEIFDAHYPDNYFDYVLFYHVIEHTVNPIACLEEIYRITKPHGRVFIGTPNIDCIAYRLYRLFQFMTFNIPSIVDGLEHTVIFSKRTLALTVKKCGFRIVKHVGEPHIEGWRTILQSNDSLARKCIRIVEKLFAVNQIIILEK